MVLAAALPLTLGACQAVDSRPSATSPAATSSATSANSQPASTGSSRPSSVRPSLSPTANRQTVDWDSGRGTIQDPAPDPSPTGWYEAAFGGSQGGQGKTLYLTFDDGPGRATADILELLADSHAKATFFVVGRQAASSPRTVRAIHAAGHAIGNHTWNHADLTRLSKSQVRLELSRTGQVVGSIMGGCMRPPYGAINSLAGTTSVAMGFQPIMWTAQAWDWRPPPTEKIVDDMKAGTKPGAVLLLHDGGGDRSRTVAALRTLLPYWEQSGYQLKSIPKCG